MAEKSVGELLSSMDEAAVFCKYYILTRNQVEAYSFIKKGKHTDNMGSLKALACGYAKKKEVKERMTLEKLNMLEFAKDLLAKSGYTIIPTHEYAEQKMVGGLRLNTKKEIDEQLNDREEQINKLMYNKDESLRQLAELVYETEDKKEKIQALKELRAMNNYDEIDTNKNIEKPVMYLPLTQCEDCPNRKKIDVEYE